MTLNDALKDLPCPYRPVCVPSQYGDTCTNTNPPDCPTFKTYLELYRKTDAWYTSWTHATRKVPLL